MDSDLKIRVTVQKGREVRKFSLRHYLPDHIPFSHFVGDLRAELNTLISEIIKRW